MGTFRHLIDSPRVGRYILYIPESELKQVSENLQIDKQYQDMSLHLHTCIYTHTYINSFHTLGIITLKQNKTVSVADNKNPKTSGTGRVGIRLKQEKKKHLIKLVEFDI